MAHPPRSNPPLRSSSGPPRPCITPSTETFVVVVSFMVAGPFSFVWSSFGTTGPPYRSHRSCRSDVLPELRVVRRGRRVFVRGRRAPALARAKRRANARGHDVIEASCEELTLQLELCSPRLIASCVETRRRPSGFRPGFWPQGQPTESTPLRRLPRTPAFLTGSRAE